MSYATIADVQERMTRPMSADEQNVCGALLEDAAVMIDAVALNAGCAVKKVVSCRMVVRALGDTGTPIGATQGSVSALGYTQSWTVGGGTTGELYIGKAERQLLGLGNRIGTYSPLEEQCTESP